MPIETDHTFESDAHIVHFYDSDEDLAKTVSQYLATAIEAGQATVVIATAAHGDAIALELGLTGVDIADARRHETFVTIDAATVLSRFRTDGHIDPDEFRSVLGGVIGNIAERTRRPVRVYGEMVALLWDAGDVLAAIELEELWNDLSGHLAFTLLCAYESRSVIGPEHADALRQVRHLHSAELGPRTDGPVTSLLPTEARAEESRADFTITVHQAAGMVAAQLGVPIEDALAQLGAAAHTEGRPLDQVAQEVVRRQRRFDPPPPPSPDLSR